MKVDRLHSLDAMRGILMLLGVYFHLAFNYRAIEKNGHIFFGWFTEQTHYFRMPAFFILAGFFGALLFYRRGAKEMILNRFKRIFLPLVIFLPFIHVIQKLGDNFSKFQEDNLGIFYSIKSTFTKTYSFWEMVPLEGTHHLWFLNFLFVMSLVVFISNKIFVKSKINNKVKSLFSLLFNKPLLGLFLFCFSFGILMSLMNKNTTQGDAPWWSWTWFLSSSGIKSFIAFSFFYFIGWQIYHHRDSLSKLKIKRYFLIGLLYNTMLYWTLGLLFNIENRSQYDYWNYSFVDNGEVWNWIPIEKKDHDKQKVTFLVDLPTELTNKKTDKEKDIYVVVAPPWDNQPGNKMLKIEDNKWTAKIELKRGVYEYRFRDGYYNSWDDGGWEDTLSMMVINGCGYGKFGNRKFRVEDEDITLGVFCWSKCSDCEGNQIPSAFYKESLKSISVKKAFIFLWNFGVPLSIMFWIAVFIQLFNKPSKILKYISDSSYWIYIVHTIFLSFVPSLFYNIEMNVFLKFIINAFIVTLLCFLSYHFMVRKTFIGKLLNGKKYD